jgi:hypothetical protein
MWNEYGFGADRSAFGGLVHIWICEDKDTKEWNATVYPESGGMRILKSNPDKKTLMRVMDLWLSSLKADDLA